ncbi:plant UBX domain-containing protein 11 isoform X2 [Cornus florida]|nr:plant UBX domain-containing protein 11 isoform X2 [Cornus florida]
MEQSISSLAFKGSIIEAITEAKGQRKLFVVYISGDDAESLRLENTWTESNVAESLLKYCILLHISEGSSDAAQFSEIYPQKSVPCITAIGYNGIQLWQNEGFVSAEILASSLEKAWLSLHIQETTASFLTAALASKKSEPHASGVSDTVSFEQGSSSSIDISSPSTASFEQGSSSSTDNSSPSTAKLVQCSEAKTHSQIIKENSGCEQSVEEINSKDGDKVSLGSSDVLESGEAEQSILSAETPKETRNPVKADQDSTGIAHMSFSVKDGCSDTKVNSSVDDHHSEVTVVASQGIANESSETVQDKKAETVEERNADVSDLSMSKSTDVHLNIRLPDGSSLQEKFSLTSTLRMVKVYVDENQASGIGSYDLAVPYPRKVFNDQELNQTLSELGLFNRQALIVVPRGQSTFHYGGGSSSRNQSNYNTLVDSSNGSNEGYFTFVKRIISYMNPFSYLGGGASSSNSMQESQTSTWQYGPNPTLQNNLGGTGRPYTLQSSTQNNPGTSRNNSKSKQQNPSRFGSNIHTLKHDEDDSRDRNAFWNGNSTEYGGNKDDK